MPKPGSNSREDGVTRSLDRSTSGYRIFIDFDNTITRGDVLDGIIEEFAVDTSWRSLEDAWAAGKIGARACLEGQFMALRARWPDLAKHLDRVRLDPGFVQLQELAVREGIELTIVSDNFDLFLEHILRKNHLANVAFRANHLELKADRLLPSFPYGNSHCPACAHCKKTHFIPPNDDQRAVVFIGDGRSDICPAQHADVVFAKDSLLAYLRDAKVKCLAYSNLTEVAEALEAKFHENKI